MQQDLVQKPKRCTKYTFRLICKHNTFYKGTTIVDFKPDIKTKKIQKRSLVPTLNKDKKYFTPTFITPFFEIPSDEKFQQQYENRVKQNNEQKSSSELLIAKPRNKTKYCGVCKQHYEDYLEHINGQKHHEMCKNSKWQKQLLSEASKFLSYSQLQICQTLPMKNSLDKTYLLNYMETQQELPNSITTLP